MIDSVNRLEAFSDGVIAIIITLMVFNLPIPTNAELETMSLWNALLSHWQDFAAFFVSFFVIGVMWINHHDLFRIIYRADHIISLLNIFLLLGITLVPFTTRLMATYIRTDQNQVSAVIYSGGYLFTAFFMSMLWRYASYKRRLIGDEISDKYVQATNLIYSMGLLLYFIGFILSFSSAQIALLINLGIAIFSAIPYPKSVLAQLES